MNRFAILCVLCLSISFALSGCSKEPTVDGASDESFEDSLSTMMEQLDETSAEDMAASIVALAFHGKDIQAEFDGLTLSEIQAKTDALLLEIEQAEAANKAKIEKDRKLRMAQEVERIKQEIGEIESALAQSKLDKKALEGFKVVESKFYFSEGLISEPIIELKVSSELDFPVSRAYFSGVVSTPGRTIPWVDEEFNYSIPGGLEPGEEVVWRLSPNLYGSWGKAPQERHALVFTAEVLAVDDANEDTVLDSRTSDRDLRRLEELKNKLSDIETD